MPDDTKSMRHREAPESTKAWETTCTAVLDGNQHALTQWLHGMQSLFDEISNLAEARWWLVMEAWAALAACRSLEEFIDCHRRLSAKITEHCSGEITKLAQMTMRMALVRPVDPDAR
jgi:phasin protein